MEHDHAAPPVPEVPKEIPSVGAVHRRASSLEPPYRGGSPAGRGGGRGMSLDRGGGATPGRGQRVMSLSQVPENERDGSPRSINFSRPISPPVSPSPPKPARGGHSGWFAAPVVNTAQALRGAPQTRPKTSDGVSQFQVHNTQHSVQNAASKPVATRKAELSHGVEGARLATGSMRAKPSGPSIPPRQPQAQVQAQTPLEPVDPKSPYAVYDPSTRKFIHKQDAMARFRELHEEEQEEPAEHYVAHHAPPARPQSPSQRHVSQPSPTPPQATRERTPSPPPRRVRRAIQQDTTLSETPSVHPAMEAEDIQDRPPTPPRARPAARLDRQTSEEFASADIKPAVDANTSRKLESTVPDPIKEEIDSPISPRLPSNQDGPYPRLSTPVIPTSIDIQPGKGKGSVRSERTHSLSPPRNAHFAAVALELPNGVKHQPPPRSVSPAKSALKASPSVSRRNSSPIANNGRVVSKGTPSEASDTVSEDGTRKKKGVRVSFEETPVIAGTSAYGEIETPTSPTGLSQSRWSTSNEEEELDDVMKPRPALPSFGSIRDKNRRQGDGDVPEKVTETVSSSMSTSVGSIAEPLESSNDHAIGGILAQDFANKSDTHASPLDPLPPEVTSVEGSGYFSDSEQSDTAPDVSNSHEPSSVVEPEQSLPEPKSLSAPIESKPPPIPEVSEIPAIAIQPASPLPIEKPELKVQTPFVPGGWEDDEEPEPEEEQETSQSEPVVAPATVEEKLPIPVSQPQDDDSTDDSSIYSDAYEELTDTEDGGFASIDAVVESPVVSPPSGLMHSKFADTSPVEPVKSSLRNEYSEDTKKEQTSTQAPARDAAEEPRSVVRDSQKQQQRDSTTVKTTPPASVPKPTRAAVPTAEASRSKQAKTTERRAQIEPTPKAPKPVSTSQPQPSAQPRKSAMKKTAVAVSPTTAPEPQMRKTMRASTAPQTASPTDTHMRRSMRSSEPISASRGPSGLAASRHSIPSAEPKPPKGALQKRNIPAATPAATTASKPRPQSASGPIRTKPVPIAPTYDSDSDASASSFQRQRPRTSRVGGGRFTMRQSMRGEPGPTMRDTPSVRPIPPPAAASPPPTSFRKSMRPSSPTPEPSGMKASRFSIRSLSPVGRFRPSKTSADDAPPLPIQASPPKKASSRMMTGFSKPSKSKAPAAKATGSRFKSRFADSSDEEEDDRPRRFQSRFADSDDDEDFELPPGLAPVRGIPKKPGDEDRDSTDLEDEASDDEPSPTKAAPKDIEKNQVPLTNGNSTGQGTSFAAGSLRKSKHATTLPTFEPGVKSKPKRGFFGLGKKKTAPPELGEGGAEPRNESSDIPMPPAHRDRNQALTPINEEKALEASPASRPRSPKLQRRSAPQWGRSASDSWPLPQAPAATEEARPQSSDGVMRRTSLRPTLTKRQSSQTSEARTVIDPKTGKEVIVGRSGKKKKFQGLRRVLGFND